jgi:glycosyltransferase involved in cell wall biosynthesis
MNIQTSSPTRPGGTAPGSIRPLRIALCLNAAWNIVNFRAGLVRALQKAGHEVIALAPPDEFVPQLIELGVTYVPIELDRKGTNPFQELKTLLGLRQALRRVRPDIYLGYTPKPNIYGAIACRSLGIPAIVNIAGLGSMFDGQGMRARGMRLLYRLALQRCPLVFFQNADDMRAFLQWQIVQPGATASLPGSGVDLNHFKQEPIPPRDHPPFVFLLVARLLWAKGLGELVAASRELRSAGLAVECRVLGPIDHGSPDAVPEATVRGWHDEGVIRYLGAATDVRPHLAQAHAVVLPSYYREGLPKTLLEAAAAGRPIVTTDSVGCRDAIVDGQTGYLCRPRDSTDLARVMRQVLSLDPSKLLAMGAAARLRAQTEFDEQIVIDRYLQAICSMTNMRARAPSLQG